MTRNEIIEIMARAIKAALLSSDDYPPPDEYLARAALSAAEAAGWVMVPREPSEAMTTEGGLAFERSMFEDQDPLVFDGAAKCYRAMLAIAGEPK